MIPLVCKQCLEGHLLEIHRNELTYIDLFRLSTFAFVLSTGVLLSCETKYAPTQLVPASSTPSKEMYQVVQQFMVADTLNHDPKFYAAYLRQDTLAGNLSMYLLDEYNSNGDVKPMPLTTWRIDQKIIFVFTGLEAVASGGDTTYLHVIRETHAANRGNIWSPPFRCWRVDVQDQKVTHIDKQVSFSDCYSFLHLAPPPPRPRLH